MKLDHKYNRKDFLEFLDSFLPEDFSQKEKDIILSKDRSKQISKATILGTCDSLGVYVLEMEHESENDPRVTIATDAFKILADHWIHKALVIFKSKKSDNYRLSLLTISLDLNEKNKAVRKYSNARRYSFYLGPDAKINTPTKYLIKKGRVTDADDLKKRFSLEVVNKDFYKEIAYLFTKLVGGSYGNGKNKKTYDSLLKLPSISDKSQTSLEFAVRLIGRVIFCWFLREKKSPNDISLMPSELLSLDAVKKNKDYYHFVLEPIFFEVLNEQVKNRKEKYTDKGFSLIPYLNGGLFSPQHEDFYSYNEGKQATFHNTVVVPDSWLQEFFEFLETYNFTIDENISFDEELSIDPEMLGRIFENLLAEINPETGESARKNTGSYYTPRTIVDYMVDESIFIYLKDKTDIDEEKLRAVISYDLLDDQKHPLSITEKEKVVFALSEIKILDPACGSGAFPMGALQKIIFILQQVDPDGQNWFKQQIKDTSPEIRRIIEREFKDKNFDYIRKLGVIRKNIFGIDIQPIATEIARLRCFLTLVVDESVRDKADNRGLEPLPNLDFKFVTANSLVGLPSSSKNTQEGLFEDRSGIAELQELRNMFFTASGSERDQIKFQFVQVQRQMLENLIDKHYGGVAELTTRLTTWDPFSHKASLWFDSEWMFGIKDGFDVVIANPPYVNVKRGVSKAEKLKYKEFYASARGQFDLFALFIERALGLSKDVVSYIVPKPFINNENYSLVRKMVMDSGITKVVIGSGIFDAAAVESCIFTSSKLSPAKNISILKFEDSSFFKKSSVDIKVFYTLPFNLISDEILSEDVPVIKKLSGSPALGKFLDIARGVEAGKSDVSIGSGVYKLLTGEDVKTWQKDYRDLVINFDTSDSKKFKPLDLYIKPKILIRRVANEIIATLDYDEYIVLNTVYCVTPKDEVKTNIKVVVAILNSKLINYWFHKVFAPTDKLFPYIRQSQIELIPIKLPDGNEEYEVEGFVDKILAITKDDDYLENPTRQVKVREYEKQIDQMVYKFYGLTKKEIEIIENHDKE